MSDSLPKGVQLHYEKINRNKQRGFGLTGCVGTRPNVDTFWSFFGDISKCIFPNFMKFYTYKVGFNANHHIFFIIVHNLQVY